jgi:topoisomerase-4 subunit B
VTLNGDGSITVEDDGRGIPVGIHPEEGVSTVEIVFTRLHAGGKFDKGSGGAYAFSGGLHGVGVSVTNALSKRLEITVWRKDEQGNGVHNLVFADGDVIEPLTSAPAERGGKKNGTRVTAWPDGKYFDSPNIPMAELQRLLRSKAVLLPGVTVTLTNAKTGDVQTWRYDEGLRGYLTEALAQTSTARP